MKNLLFLLSASLLFPAQASPDKRSDRERWDLKGPVETVRTERAVATMRGGQWVEGKRRLETVVTYDEAGRKVEELKYGMDGALLRRIAVASDAEGNTVYEEYKPDGTLANKTTFKTERDAEGRWSRTKVERSDGLVYDDSITTFDSDGKPLERRSFARDGSPARRSVFVYDGRKLAEFLTYNESGVLTQRQKITGAEHESVLYDFYNRDGTLRESIRYKETVPSDFDAHGNWTKEIRARSVIKDDLRGEQYEVVYRTFTYH